MIRIGFQFSKDYRGPALGLLTKARGYDKWAHFAGSAAGVLAVLAFWRYLTAVPLETILSGPALAVASAISFGFGLAIEVKQGIGAGTVAANPDMFVVGELGSIALEDDGFSFLDLAADVLGILLVWGALR